MNLSLTTPLILWLLLMFSYIYIYMYILYSLETLEVTKWSVLLLKMAGIRLHADISQVARENHPSRPASTSDYNNSPFCWTISPTLPLVTAMGLVRGLVLPTSGNPIFRDQHAFEKQQRTDIKKRSAQAAQGCVDLAPVDILRGTSLIACQVGSNKVVARAELVTCIYMGHYVNGRFSAATVHQMSGDGMQATN